jgi:hypothetical protein
MADNANTASLIFIAKPPCFAKENRVARPMIAHFFATEGGAPFALQVLFVAVTGGLAGLFLTKGLWFARHRAMNLTIASATAAFALAVIFQTS